MLDTFFSSIITNGITGGVFFACTAASLVLGALIALLYTRGSRVTPGFIVTLALLPAAVQLVIMLVNGQIGTAIAITGAFTLVRFRSIPGTAKEIGALFLSMAVGVACGGGYIGIAAVFTVIMLLVSLLYSALRFGEPRHANKTLNIVIPEGLDYTGLFDDLFEKYTASHDLTRVKSTNMGSLFQLTYNIELKDAAAEKALIDDIRCRNGNLDIVCSKVAFGRDEL